MGGSRALLAMVLAGCSGSLSNDDPAEDGGVVDLGGPDAPDGATDLGSAAGDGGGPQADAATDNDGGPVVAPDAGPGTAMLLERSGCFYTANDGETFRRFAVGDNGTAYASVRVRFDVIAGPFQPHIPDPSNRTEHILFGFSRANQAQSFQRYVMGVGAIDFQSRTDHFRMYGREDIAMGFMSYTADSGNQRWMEGTRYTVDCTLDGVTPVQRCTLEAGGEVLATRELPVPYLDSATHLSSGFQLELGTDQPIDHDHLQSPRGWEFCDLSVTAEPL